LQAEITISEEVYCIETPKTPGASNVRPTDRFCFLKSLGLTPAIRLKALVNESGLAKPYVVAMSKIFRSLWTISKAACATLRLKTYRDNEVPVCLANTVLIWGSENPVAF